MPRHIVYSMAVFFKVAFAFAVPVLCALSPVYQTFVVALICTVKPRYMVGAVRNNSTRAERVAYCKGRYERIGIPEVVRIVPVVCAGIVLHVPVGGPEVSNSEREVCAREVRGVRHNLGAPQNVVYRRGFGSDGVAQTNVGVPLGWHIYIVANIAHTVSNAFVGGVYLR